MRTLYILHIAVFISIILLDRYALSFMYKKYLIDYANLNQGLIANQKEFLNLKKFKFFLNKPSMGLPLMLPFGLDCFDYKNVKETFELNRKDIYKKIFRTKINFYHAAETFFKYGNVFCVGAKPKKNKKELLN